MEKKKSFAFGWSQVINWLIAWVFLGFVVGSGTSVYRSAIYATNGLDEATVLYVVSVVGWIGLLAYILAPIVVKKFGAKTLLVWSAILGGIIFAVTPLFTNSILAGIFCGLNDVVSCTYCVVPTVILVSKWFPRKKAVIMGIITAGGIISSLILLPIFNALMAGGGIKTAMLVFGIAMVVYGIVSIFWAKETPQECGLLPDNMPLDQGKVEMLGTNDVTWTLGDVLKNGKFWCSSIGWGLILAGILGFLSIGFPYMLMSGVSMEGASTVMMFTGIGTCVFSVLSGIWDEKVNSPVPPSICIVILEIIGFAICAFYVGASTALPIIAVLLLFSVFGTTNNLYSSQMLSLMGPKNYNIGFNALCFITSAIKVLGTTIIAWSLTSTGTYQTSYIVLAILGLIGGILVVIAGKKKVVPSISEAANATTAQK